MHNMCGRRFANAWLVSNPLACTDAASRVGIQRQRVESRWKIVGKNFELQP